MAVEVDADQLPRRTVQWGIAAEVGHGSGDSVRPAKGLGMARLEPSGSSVIRSAACEVSVQPIDSWGDPPRDL